MAVHAAGLNELAAECVPRGLLFVDFRVARADDGIPSEPSSSSEGDSPFLFPSRFRLDIAVSFPPGMSRHYPFP